MRMNEEYEVDSIEAISQKYGLVAENAPVVEIDVETVPLKLRPLIPFVKIFGVSDDTIREDIVRKSPQDLLLKLKDLMNELDDDLDNWLDALPEESGDKPDVFYAFVCARMVADFL